MEVDSEDPVSSKGLLGVSLASVIAPKKGFENTTLLGIPLGRLVAAPRGVLGICALCQPKAAASPSQPVAAGLPMPGQGLPPWK